LLFSETTQVLLEPTRESVNGLGLEPPGWNANPTVQLAPFETSTVTVCEAGGDVYPYCAVNVIEGGEDAVGLVVRIRS
jgi:hypothetical protein